MGYVGTRATGTGAGSYVIAGPDWNGTPKKKLKIIRSTTPYAMLLGRVLLLGSDDMKNVEAIQKQFKLQPLSAFEGRKPPKMAVPAFPKPASEDGPLGFFRTLGHALQFNPPVLPQDSHMIPRLRRLRYNKDWSFDVSRHGPRQRKVLAQAVADGRKLLTRITQAKGATEHGWMKMVPGVGDSGRNYLLRAGVAKKALWACTAEEASYRIANVDAGDKPMTGAHRYELRFAKAPPARAFWSLSLYNFETNLLVENPINRWSIGDRTPGLVRAKDGSVTIRIQHARPKGEGVNWLPAPSGRFYVVLRLYIPTEAYLKGTYKIPGIKKL